MAFRGLEFFRSILIGAVFAGIAAGVVLTGLQVLKVYPLILAAEQFEDGGAQTADWAPAGGGERLLYSLISNVLSGVGLGLVLAAVFALRGVAGWRQGALWGGFGFIAVHLAPAVGLPPELPGMPAADLAARQIWWWATVALTAGGLALIFLLQGLPWRLAGALAIAAPQFYGAPHPDGAESAVPATLAAQFATASLAANLIFWTLLGALAAALARPKPHDTP